jgi:hypothetical protein
MKKCKRESIIWCKHYGPCICYMYCRQHQSIWDKAINQIKKFGYKLDSLPYSFPAIVDCDRTPGS